MSKTKYTASPASHPSSNFKDTETVSLIMRLLSKHGRVMPDIKTIDKWPNIDGRVDVQNEEGGLIGTITVQAKTLPSSHNLKLSCPVAFLAYCKVEPCILLAADNLEDKLYWLYFDHRIVDSMDIEGKGHKTIELDEAQVIDLDHSDYADKWSNILEQNQTKLREYDSLEKAYLLLRETTNPSLGVSKGEHSRLHEFLDELNSAYDKKFLSTKVYFYPNTWKLGIAYEDYSKDSLSYMLYPIPHGKNDVQIKEIDDSLRTKLVQEGVRFAAHFVDNPIEQAPKEYATKLIRENVNKLLKAKRLVNTGNDVLSREYIFSFVDKFHEQLGLPIKDTYAYSELKFALGEYLPRWLFVSYTYLMAHGRDHLRYSLQRNGFFDPDPQTTG